MSGFSCGFCGQKSFDVISALRHTLGCDPKKMTPDDPSIMKKRTTIQNQHLQEVEDRKERERGKCLHDQCTECLGTGVKKDGNRCVHMISCPCRKCSPTYM